MGLLTTIVESNDGMLNVKPADAQRTGYRESIINYAGRLYDEDAKFKKYTSLAGLLENGSDHDKYIAAVTMYQMENTHRFIENMKVAHGESTVMGNLGQLNSRIMDVVRIFYPNQIATDLVDIQPIDGEVGQIFTMTPRYTNSLDNITAQDEMFAKMPTNGNYASEILVRSQDGDGTTTTFAQATQATYVPVRPGTLVVTATAGGNTVSGKDTGSGDVAGTGVTGTINYATGAISVTFSTAPDAGSKIYFEYLYSAEEYEEGIRQVEFDLELIPVKARMHPLTYKYSVPAGLAAAAHLAIDVSDTLATTAAEYIKVERDHRLVRQINNAAVVDPALNFNADISNLAYGRAEFYGEIGIKIDVAMSGIQSDNGRGGVDWILAGSNASQLFSRMPGFRAEAVRNPIGPHRIGTVRDGTVAVIKVTDTNILGANDYIFGFKGYMLGDAATILAEWIPIYFTPEFQAPTLTNRRGLMSMYDMFTQKGSYYRKGTLSNYSG